MNYPETIKPAQYLHKKGIDYLERGGELVLKCLFSGCDQDSRGNEAHLHIHKESGLYHCKKCGEKGNLVTLAKHLGDSPSEVFEKESGYSASKKVKSEDGPPPISMEEVERCHAALPDHIRGWLNARGIPDEIIANFKIGYGSFYGHSWIAFPVFDLEGKPLFFKLRKDPNDHNNPDKGKFYPLGSKAALYNASVLATDDEVMVCEGECDCIIAVANGMPAVTSTAGAGTFKDEWLGQFQSLRKVYVCFDNDKAGKDGADSLVKKLLSLGGPKVLRINLPDMGEGKKDLTDFFIAFEGDIDQLIELAEEVSTQPGQERFKKVDPPKRSVSIDEWKSIITTNFPDCAFAAEVCLSVVAQILIKDITNPFALVLVDVPSAGKTITINMFAEIADITYTSDRFTPASFVSNAANVRTEKLAEVDLLPRLRYKTFLIRDMATLFGERDDDLLKSLGTLTRILDGEGFQTDSGVHGQRKYVGEYLFMMIAGSTPIQQRVWKLMGSLGARLFFLNMSSGDKSEDELADQLVDDAYKLKETRCKEATQDFLYGLWNMHSKGVVWDKKADPKELRLVIVRCAKLLARLRGVINASRERQEDGFEQGYADPVVEKPLRINQLLYNVCRGHALVCGRTSLTEEDLAIPLKLAFDSAPKMRVRLFKALVEAGGSMRTGQVERALQCSKPTALKEMEALSALGVSRSSEVLDGGRGEPEKTITLVDDLTWFLSDECRRLRGMSPRISPEEVITLFSGNQ